MKPVPRMPFPTNRTGFEEVIEANTPVVFESAAADWPCTKQWSLDYLKQKVGDTETLVTVSPGPLFKGDPTTGHYTAEQMRPMKFGAFLDTIAEGARAGEHLYAHKQNFNDLFPGLKADIVVPDFIRGRAWEAIFLWMGPQGSITQIHHDFTDNLFVMVRGRKRVRLFDPYQEASLYRFPFKTLNGRSSWHLAQIPSATDPDLQRFPKFNGVTYQEVVMEPGNLLLIPNFWWHEVESLDQPSISLAYWWSDRTRSEIEGTIEKITGFAEDLAELPPDWKKFVLSVMRRHVLAGEP